MKSTTLVTYVDLKTKKRSIITIYQYNMSLQSWGNVHNFDKKGEKEKETTIMLHVTYLPLL